MKKKRNQQLQLNPKRKRKGRPDEELDDDVPSRINPLTPVSDDSGLTVEVAMDCEMVVSVKETKAPLEVLHWESLVNRWGNVVYDEFVRPVQRVVDFRTEISGIRPRDLRKQRIFELFRKKVAELIKGRTLVGHALRNDLKALLLSHPKEDIRDTLEYEPFMRGEGSRRAHRHLAAEFLDVKIQNIEHCPIEDARAAMVLCQKNRKAWEKRVEDQIKLKQRQKKREPKRKRAKGDELETDDAETES